MKLFNTIAAAAVIGGSFLIPHPAEAGHVSKETNLCKRRGCSMTLEEFAERMSFSSGTDFKFSNSRDSFCKKNRNTLGYYSPALHAITMCNENSVSAVELANTIAHETVHAGQACFKANVPFDKGILSSTEKAMVQRLYPSNQWQGEYNARAIANYLVRRIGDSDRFAHLIENRCASISTNKLPRNSSMRALHR